MLPLQSIVWLAAILLPLAGIGERKAYHQYCKGFPFLALYPIPTIHVVSEWSKIRSQKRHNVMYIKALLQKRKNIEQVEHLLTA